MTMSMQFDAVSEALPGDKWLSRWHRSWPAYRSWFINSGGQNGPSRKACEMALLEYMPELLPTWKKLTELTGDDDLAARFLSTWCPPTYLGGCSLAALSRNGSTHLVRNYDLSPELNEGLLLHSAWNGTKVMGMIEFLWGLSDGINDKGLAVALAYGGSREVGRGFGITTLLRYVMETCGTVAEALAALRRVPSHMAYNVTLADSTGMTLTLELHPGGGLKVMEDAIATNHQSEAEVPEKAVFTETFERFTHLESLLNSDIAPHTLADEFLVSPLHQTKYAQSLGTLFTADYNVNAGTLELRWQKQRWSQSLSHFTEQTSQISFDSASQTASSATPADPESHGHSAWLQHISLAKPWCTDKEQFSRWLAEAESGNVNWSQFGDAFRPRG